MPIRVRGRIHLVRGTRTRSWAFARQILFFDTRSFAIRTFTFVLVISLRFRASCRLDGAKSARTKHKSMGMQKRAVAQNRRCTAADYRKLFAANSDQFRQLCRMLTCHEQRARTSLEKALDQSLKSASLVFRECMLHWARRLIIKSCIESTKSEIRSAARSFSSSETQQPDVNTMAQPLLMMAPEIVRENLPALDPLSRFVIALRVLEGYSHWETALLLDVDERTCIVAYLWASTAMLNAITLESGEPTEASTMMSYLSGPGMRIGS